MPGRVIVLNRTSSSGKSSLVRALQDGLDGAWLVVGSTSSCLRGRTSRTSPREAAEIVATAVERRMPARPFSRVD